MYVYIMASKSRVLYVGVTGDMVKRIYEHKTATTGFTADYRVNRLVYVEEIAEPIRAIEREKRLKSLLRSRKIALIEKDNPAWDDLAEVWFPGISAMAEEERKASS
jgi:putative endonuclease